MDFGNILDKWEKGTGKKANTTSKSINRRDVNPMDAWLNENKVIDKDALLTPEQETSAARRSRLLNKRHEDFIDIHGLTREEAWLALERFIENCAGRGLEKVLIIHGKGNHSKNRAVLKLCVRDFLEKCPYTGESGQSDTGGTGATWVLLKKEKGIRQAVSNVRGI